MNLFKKRENRKKVSGERANRQKQYRQASRQRAGRRKDINNKNQEVKKLG